MAGHCPRWAAYFTHLFTGQNRGVLRNTDQDLSGIGFHYEYAFTPETYRAFLENLRLAPVQLEVISGHVPEGIAILEKLC